MVSVTVSWMVIVSVMKSVVVMDMVDVGWETVTVWGKVSVDVWGMDCVIVSITVFVTVPEMEGVDERESVGVAIIDTVEVMGAVWVGDVVGDCVFPVMVACCDRVSVFGVLADAEREGVVEWDRVVDWEEVVDGEEVGDRVAVGVPVRGSEWVCVGADDLVGTGD